MRLWSKRKKSSLDDLNMETHMAGKRHQAWRNLMVAAVLMTGSPANANDRAVHAAYCEQVALDYLHLKICSKRVKFCLKV